MNVELLNSEHSERLNDRAEREPLTVVGWLWKQEKAKLQYTPEHANIWARMIDRHLTLPHRFVLVTDQPDAKYDPLIEPIPLWEDWRSLKNPNWGEGRAHCYVRLKAFSEEARALLGPRFVSIDLDVVVLENLDPLFDRPDDFLIYRRAVKMIPLDQINAYQASMWMMTAGARKQVWEQFKGMETVQAARGYIGSDQAVIRHILGDGEKGWSQADGVYGWPAVRRAQCWSNPPADARLVFFYGGVKPWLFHTYTYNCRWITENYQ